MKNRTIIKYFTVFGFALTGLFMSCDLDSDFMPSGGGTTATCTDGIENGDETGIDCGGSCFDCIKTFQNTFQNFGGCRAIIESEDGFVMLGVSSGNVGLLFLDLLGEEISVKEFQNLGTQSYTISKTIDNDGFVFVAVDPILNVSNIIRTNKFGTQNGTPFVLSGRIIIQKILLGNNLNYFLFGYDATNQNQKVYYEFDNNLNLLDSRVFGNGSFFDAVNFSGDNFAIIGTGEVTIFNNSTFSSSSIAYPTTYNLRSILIDEINNEFIISGFDAVPNSDFQRFILKTDFSGNQIGNILISGNGTYDNGVYKSDGNIFVAGSEEQSNGGTSVALISLSKEGVQLQNEILYENLATPRGMIRSEDGGFVITGFVPSTPTSIGSSFILKVNKEGEIN